MKREIRWVICVGLVYIDIAIVDGSIRKGIWLFIDGCVWYILNVIY